MLKFKSSSTDISWLLNSFKTDNYEIAQYLLRRFDFESTNDYSKVKHYSLDVLVKDSVEDIDWAIEFVSKKLWAKLAFKLQLGKSTEVVELEIDERSPPINYKIGKIYFAPPNTFAHVNTEVPSPQLYGTAYTTEDGLELACEVNFGVELY